MSSLLPPGTCLQFLTRIGFSIPTARRFSSKVPNSRFRAFRESICAQEKVPTIYAVRICNRGDSNSRNWHYSSSRHEDNLLRHRGDRLISSFDTSIIHQYLVSGTPWAVWSHNYDRDNTEYIGPGKGRFCRGMQLNNIFHNLNRNSRKIRVWILSRACLF